MPRVKMWTDPKQELVKETRKIIKQAMAEKELRQKDLAELLRMRASTLSYKLIHGGWTQDEFLRIMAVLPISLEDAAVMCGYKGKSA